MFAVVECNGNRKNEDNCRGGKKLFEQPNKQFKNVGISIGGSEK